MSDNAKKLIGWIVGTSAVILTGLSGAELIPTTGTPHKVFAVIVISLMAVQMRLPATWGAKSDGSAKS